MLQQEYPARSAPYCYAPNIERLNVLAYKSVAVGAPTDSDIQHLLWSAQARNKAEGLTGVLLYDRGTFFQWLEGSTESLARVWNSISHDPRHCHVEVLRDEPISARVFEEWDLRVVRASSGAIDAAIVAMDSSDASLKHVIRNPKSILDLSLEDVFTTIVLPRLSEVHERDMRPCVRRLSTATIWHAELDSGARFASLLASHPARSSRYVDSLLEQGADLNALYCEVFEPARLHLGKLWDDDQCDDFHLAVGLAHLQLEVRRVISFLPTEHVIKPNHRVLLCSQPREPDGLGPLMSSELFHRKGWAAGCEFPSDDETLQDLVRSNWFDVLKISQSGSLRRDSRLCAMRATIDSARSASLNPSLIVMVDGRTFLERPQIYRAVHANAMSASSLEAVPLAERLLTATRRVNALRQVS